MTELSKDNDQESSYKEAFRSPITLLLSQNCQTNSLQTSTLYSLTLQTQMTKTQAESNSENISNQHKKKLSDNSHCKVKRLNDI